MTAALFRTELRLWMRDFFSVFFTFVFPVLMLLLFGSMFGKTDSPTYGASMTDTIIPAYTVIILSFTGLMDLPLSISGSMERRIYKRFDATPAGKEILIGLQILVNAVMSAVGILILLTAACCIFGYRMHGSVFAAAGALFLSCISTFSAGLLLAIAAPNMRSAQALCCIVYFVSLFLSGATIPAFLFPPALQTVSDFLPATYAVRLTQSAFLGIEGEQTALNALVLTVCSAIFLLLAWRLAKRKDWSK